MAAEKQTFSSGWGHPNCPYWIDLIVQETAVNTTENYSDVFFDLRARSEKSWDLEFRGRLGYIAVDGTRIQEAYTDLSAYDGDGGAYNRRICSITKRIYHDSDGKKTINVEGYYDYSGILISKKWYLSAVSVANTYTLTNISRKPSITISIKEQRQEEIDFEWSSDLACNQVWVEYGSEPIVHKFPVDNKKSGVVTVKGLTPNTNYSMRALVKSIAELWSDVKTLSAKTTNTSSFISKADFEFGSNLEVKKNNNSNFKDDIYLYVNDKLILSRTSIPNTYTITFKQSELDAMYKLFGKKNTAKTTLKLVSHGSSADYTSTINGTLTLTGNAKTIHVGVNNKPKRGIVWIGEGKIPRKAVVWIGVNGTPQRSI